MTENEETFSGVRGSVATRRRRNARLAAGGAVLVAAAALLTGCGGGNGTASAPHTVGGDAVPAGGDTSASASASPGGGTTGSAPSSSTGTDTTSPSATAGSGTTAGTVSHTSTERCHTSELKASIGPNDPGAGQENFAVVLTNHSGRTCTVFGFPGLAFLNAAGEQVSVNPERATGQTAEAVRLAPGRSAWSGMKFSNPDITGVTTVTPKSVLVTPPDEKAALKIAWKGGPVTDTGKASVPQLTALTAGTGV